MFLSIPLCNNAAVMLLTIYRIKLKPEKSNIIVRLFCKTVLAFTLQALADLIRNPISFVRCEIADQVRNDEGQENSMFKQYCA